MKKQAARTITTLSLFIALSVGASNVFAFPTCTGCKPLVLYAASAPVQTTNSTPAPATAANAPTDTQSESSVGSLTLFLARVLTIFVSLF